MVTRAAPILALLTAAALFTGCGDEARGPRSITLQFEPIVAGPNEEISGLCQSYTLNNDEPLYVNAVHQRNDGFWHHSNWTFVPDHMYTGPDGSWRCSERGFNEVTAGVAGGVFFAQSTQTLEEEQRFAPGYAYRIPPNSRVVGGVHILNLSGDTVETAIELEAELIRESEVVELLQPMAFTNVHLAIPPVSESEFIIDCPFNRPMDFDVHYVLGHYHDLGTLLRLEVIGGPGDGDLIYETTSATGEPLGDTVSPPFQVRGAESLRMTCGYENNRADTVGYGIGDQEMCVFLSYITGDYKYAASSVEDSVYVGEEGGVLQYDAPCLTLTTYQPQ
jgi:hypothetical protein